MVSQHQARGGDGGRPAFILGIYFALLLAVPLWAGIGIAAVLLFQDGPFTKGQTAGLAAAAAAEIILLRCTWRALRPQWRFRVLLAPVIAARPTRSFLKQSALLGGLAAAYLHYYFWDVHLQIATLHKVSVFI